MRVRTGSAGRPAGATVVVLTGVAGSGKSTVGRALADRLGWAYADADDFHTPAAIAKMASGRSLTDADRWPWLRAIGRWIDGRVAAGGSAVVACSALKRAYREALADGRPAVHLVHLDVPEPVLATRLRRRAGHFMRASMLGGQLAELEPPEPDEGVLVVDGTAPPDRIVTTILNSLFNV